jgi:transcriptional regulator with XRE-family HTH domain
MSDDAARLALFGARLRRARVEAGLTQRQVGEHIGVAQTEVSNYERGRYQPNRGQLEGLAELLGLEVAPDVWRVAERKRRPPGGWAGVICPRAVSRRSTRSGCVRVTTSASGGHGTWRLAGSARSRDVGRASTAAGAVTGERTANAGVPTGERGPSSTRSRRTGA